MAKAATHTATYKGMGGDKLPVESVKPQRLPPVVVYHDIFNLVTLGLLNALNIVYLVTGKNFSTFYFATMLYFVADLMYVGIVPRCVKSPLVILAHHVITAAYVLIPYNYPQYEWCMSYCMLVEINTVLLIAKRTFPNRPLLDVLFYISWFVLRCLWYPYLIYVFYREWQVETRLTGTPYNWIAVTPLFQTFLTALNYHWTIQLLMRKADRKPKQL